MILIPGQRGISVLNGFLVVLFAAFISGCSGCQAPPIIDAPASSLDLTVSVLDIDETPSDGKVIVVMQFFQGGKVVQLASNISLSCNGVPLTWNGLVGGHAERIPIQGVGGTYMCLFSRGGTNNSATVTVPPRPVFSAPTIAGALLSRTSNFTIHYVAGTGTSVRGNASDASTSTNNSQPDDGTHDGLDVSGFAPGPGTLSITRTLEGVLSGTGFLSAKSHYDTNKQATITWL
jgi:hypothetical protein